MIRKAGDAPRVSVEGLMNGKKSVDFLDVLTVSELNGHGRKYAMVTLEPGASIGYHQHKNESESYFILSGRARCCDNGTDVILEPGDMECCLNGCGHDIENIGTEPLVFMALIMFDEQKR